MLKTSLCRLLNIEYPIILAGMAYAGNYRLAAAVSEAGGLGVIASGHMALDELESEIESYRSLTKGPLGVNCFLKDVEALQKAEICLKMEVDIIFTGIGNPAPVMPYAKKAGIKVIPTVATVRHAHSAIKAGVDMIVAEGQEGGGHIGSVGTLPLIAQVRDAVGDRVPVIAAGGIGDGRQVVACLVMGAVGVMMGTRFLVADECPVHDTFKESIIKAGIDDTTVTGSFTGFPMRCLANDFTRQFQEMEKVQPSYEMLLFGKGKIREGLMEGDVMTGSCPAGQVIGQLTKRQNAGDIVRQIVSEAEEVIGRMIASGGFDGWAGGGPIRA